MNSFLILSLWLQRQKCGYREKKKKKRVLSRTLWNPLCLQEPTISICHLRHRCAGRWGHICGTCHLVFCHSERSTLPLSTLPFSQTYPFHFRIGVGRGRVQGTSQSLTVPLTPQPLTSLLTSDIAYLRAQIFFLALWHILSNIWFLANQDYLSFKAISFRSNIQNFKSQECYWCV